MDYEDDNISWIPFLDEDDPLPGQVSPFASVSPSTIEMVLGMLNPTKDDVLLDIGCGDGR